MKKRIFAALMALLVCLACVAPAYGDIRSYVQDDAGRMTDAQVTDLNEVADALENLTGIRAYFAETADEGDAEAYANTVIDALGIDQAPGAVLLAVTADQWCIQLLGSMNGTRTADEVNALWADADDNESRTGYALASAYYAALPDFLPSGAPDSASSMSGGKYPLLVDNAELLTADERASLLERLTDLSAKWQLDIAVITTPGLDGKSLQDYTDDFYDLNGYGQGAEHDGVMLLVNMGRDGSERACHITAVGAAIPIFTDARRDRIASDFLPDLKDGDYAAAFRTFADDADYYINASRSGENGDGNDGDASYRAPFNWQFAIPVSLVVGLIVALIAVGSMKRQLKSVGRKTGAADYTRAGSLNVTNAAEFFLYSHVDRRERPKDNDNGGSTTHTSSSGVEHSGSSYKF